MKHIHNDVVLVEETCTLCEQREWCLPYIIPHDDWDETGDFDQAYICKECMEEEVILRGWPNKKAKEK